MDQLTKRIQGNKSTNKFDALKEETLDQTSSVPVPKLLDAKRIKELIAAHKQKSVPVTILNPHPNFPLFSTIYFTLSVTCPSLVPSRAARTATKSPDKSPDGPHD